MQVAPFLQGVSLSQTSSLVVTVSGPVGKKSHFMQLMLQFSYSQELKVKHIEELQYMYFQHEN